ncbi:MAG: carboxypeptidase-like regulatory domain-containing protein, partial [Terriglobia bacterium]
MFWRNKWTRVVTPFAGLLLFVASVAIPVRISGQVSGGALSGSITDGSGRAMPNTKVSLTNVVTGATRTVKTDTRGLYAA